MRRIDRLSMALQSMRTRKTRTSLTVAAILIGITSVIVVSTMGASFEESIAGEFQGLDARSVFTAASYGNPTNGPPDAGQFGTILTETDRLHLAGIEHVEQVVPEGTIQATGLSHDDREVPLSTLTATTAAEPTLQDMERYAAGGPFVDGQSEVVLGATIHRVLGGDERVQTGDRIEILLPGGAHANVTVAGILAHQDTLFGAANDQVYVPIDPFYDAQGRRPATGESVRVYDGFTIVVTDLRHLPEVKAQVREYMDTASDADALRADGVEILVFTATDVTSEVRASFDRATLLIAAIAATSLFVAGIMVATIMIINVTERRREIGLMKAVGARDRDVRGIVLLEAGLIGLLGGLLGTATGLGLGIELVHLVFSGGVPVVIPWGWIVVAVVIATLTGIVAGTVPARRAMRVEPVKALGYE